MFIALRNQRWIMLSICCLFVSGCGRTRKGNELPLVTNLTTGAVLFDGASFEEVPLGRMPRTAKIGEWTCAGPVVQVYDDRETPVGDRYLRLDRRGALSGNLSAVANFSGPALDGETIHVCFWFNFQSKKRNAASASQLSGGTEMVVNLIAEPGLGEENFYFYRISDSKAADRRRTKFAVCSDTWQKVQLKYQVGQSEIEISVDDSPFEKIADAVDVHDRIDAIRFSTSAPATEYLIDIGT